MNLLMSRRPMSSTAEQRQPQQHLRLRPRRRDSRSGPHIEIFAIRAREHQSHATSLVSSSTYKVVAHTPFALLLCCSLCLLRRVRIVRRRLLRLGLVWHVVTADRYSSSGFSASGIFSTDAAPAAVSVMINDEVVAQLQK
jgi:hypothetical protein